MKPTQNIKIPVGRSGFADIRENGYYYVDKSRLIEELLRTDGIQAALITRPRRFGKTLAMNMLADFFDIRKDSRPLFEGLAIAENAGLCAEWIRKRIYGLFVRICSPARLDKLCRFVYCLFYRANE